MPLLSKRKDKALIPPVEPQNTKTSPAPSSRYHSNANTYVPSRDGDLSASYKRSSAQQTPEPLYETYEDWENRDKYRRNAGVGDVYSRGGPEDRRQLDQDRNELFSGYDPQKSGSGRFFDGPNRDRPTPPPGEETEEDVEAIKSQTRYVKQESSTSAKNALRLAMQAEDTAVNTLGRLGDQSEKLANTEMHIDISKTHSARAGDRTDELKQLNKSIFRPVITFNKDGKRAAQEAKIQARYDEQREQREKAMMDVRETQNRLGRVQGYGQSDEGITGGQQTKAPGRNAQRSRYQFEATASDDELEDSIDKDLDDIEAATKRLRMYGLAMGDEIGAQNARIGNIGDKMDGLDLKIAGVTSRQKKFS